MIEIEEMAVKEMQDLLQKVGYGHLGCAREGRPYVVPVHYAYADPDLYIFTTEGMKTDYIAANPEVCLQVEEVHNPANWRSVIVTGQAEHITKSEDTEHAMQFITEQNPTLTPAINKMWIDVWGRANVVAIYRIHPSIISGRKTLNAGDTRGKTNP
ncbi:MAG: pyridoxamine 5'-phosphate oxidase family protein [Pyrinomonadaceae bacterium]|nr:pyridoxamine 5'-phosphate oxidase family protein [Pyrinomonadaceae bacterium]